MKSNKMFLIIGVIVFCLIGVFIVYNEKKKKIERSLDKIPFTAINKLQQNKFSKVKEKVLPATEPLTAPISIVNAKTYPKNFKSYITSKEIISENDFSNNPEKLEAILNQFNAKTTTFKNSRKKVRAFEAIIEVNEKIVIAGTAKWKTLNEPIKGYSYSKVIALENTLDQQIIITNLPLTDSKK